MYIFKTFKRYGKIRIGMTDDRIQLWKREEQNPESQTVCALVQNLNLSRLMSTTNVT